MSFQKPLSSLILATFTEEFAIRGTHAFVSIFLLQVQHRKTDSSINRCATICFIPCGTSFRQIRRYKRHNEL